MDWWDLIDHRVAWKAKPLLMTPGRRGKAKSAISIHETHEGWEDEIKFLNNLSTHTHTPNTLHTRMRIVKGGKKKWLEMWLHHVIHLTIVKAVSVTKAKLKKTHKETFQQCEMEKGKRKKVNCKYTCGCELERERERREKKTQRDCTWRVTGSEKRKKERKSS